MMFGGLVKMIGRAAARVFSSAADADADADAEAEAEGDALEWRVGMRLEALDRKNPRLICVAAIAEVRTLRYPYARCGLSFFNGHAELVFRSARFVTGIVHA